MEVKSIQAESVELAQTIRLAEVDALLGLASNLAAAVRAARDSATTYPQMTEDLLRSASSALSVLIEALHDHRGALKHEGNNE